MDLDPRTADDIYADVYEEPEPQSPVWTNYGSINTFFRAAFALLLRAGFILIQIGTMPITDVNRIILHHFVDIACSSAAFGILGYMFAFGPDRGRIIGAGSWILSENADLDNAVLGWAAVIIATALFSTIMAGRIHGIGIFIVVVIFAAFVQPLVMHWAWVRSGWLFNNSFLGRNVAFKDMGGGSVVHVCGGLLALLGALFVGRRILNLRSIDESSIPTGSPASTALGYVLVMISLMALCLPTPTYERYHNPGNYVGIIVINNIMAIGGGMLTVIAFYFVRTRIMMDYWFVMRCLQGGVAGMVTVAAGVDVYRPLVAFLVAVLGTSLFYILAVVCFASAVEDCNHMIPVHLLCGFFGTLIPPIAGSREGLGATHNIVANFGWQLIGALAIAATVAIIMLIVFIILKCFGLLRNVAEERNYQRAVKIADRVPRRSYFKRLLYNDPEYPQFILPGYRTKNEASYIEKDYAQRDQKDLQALMRPGMRSSDAVLKSKIYKRGYSPTVNPMLMYGDQQYEGDQYDYNKTKIMDDESNSPTNAKKYKTRKRGGETIVEEGNSEAEIVGLPINQIKTVAVYTALHNHKNDSGMPDNLILQNASLFPRTDNPLPGASFTPDVVSTALLQLGMKNLKILPQLSETIPNVFSFQSPIIKILKQTSKFKNLYSLHKQHMIPFTFFKQVTPHHLNTDDSASDDTNTRKKMFPSSTVLNSSSNMLQHVRNNLALSNGGGDFTFAVPK